MCDNRLKIDLLLWLWNNDLIYEGRKSQNILENRNSMGGSVYFLS